MSARASMVINHVRERATPCKWWRSGLWPFLCWLMVAAAPAWADARGAEVPPAVARMIDIAFETGDAGKFGTVVDVAKAAHPEASAAISAQAARLRARGERARAERIESAGVFDLLEGEGEAGAFLSTGNTDEGGLAVGLKLQRDGLQWRHSFEGRIDYRENEGEVTREYYLASYQLDYEVSETLYALGLVSWERDSFAGYSRRLIASLGVGYHVIESPAFTLDLEGGAALRQTDYLLTDDEDEIVARGGLGLRWRVREGVTLREDLAAFVGGTTSTLTSTTSLTARLIEAVSARVSVDLRHETDPEPGRAATDTRSRVTLVYDF